MPVRMYRHFADMLLYNSMKYSNMPRPHTVSLRVFLRHILSGWNWTPIIGSSVCSKASITPSSGLIAATLKPSAIFSTA